jgi:hypothetical protein
MFNQKRGQEGVTLTTLLLIILGAIVVVVIILGTTGIFGDIFKASDQLPRSLQVMITGCELKASQNLKADYCAEFKEVELNGKNQYVSCKYLEEKHSTLFKDKPNYQAENCKNVAINIDEYCLNKNLKTNELINGENCKPTCESFNEGVFVDNSLGCAQGGKIELEKIKYLNKESMICCYQESSDQ